MTIHIDYEDDDGRVKPELFTDDFQILVFITWLI
jgi:hypothetical protein